MITEKTILSVSQLNRRAKQLLETHLPLIWVSGELSNLAKPGSGHWYFSLKDQQAQVRCAMFRNANQRVRHKVESGQQVLIRARVSLYEGRREFQLNAEHIEPAGVGLLQQQYEALKQKLAHEGLSDEANKQSLPAFPQQIGVITSPTGAAIHDILSVLKRRYPVAPVSIFPVSVQGETAALEMTQALAKAQQAGHCDLLIIGRGGGSIEDLWAFNDEGLARAIAQCAIPIVSAVGHEVDFTIADFVADLRAPTPSASAELSTPDMSEWQQLLDDYQRSLCSRLSSTHQRLEQRLHALRQRLRHPGERIDLQQQQLTLHQRALADKMHIALHQKSNRLKQLQTQLQRHHPKGSIEKNTLRLAHLKEKLFNSTNDLLHQKEQQFLHQTSLLNAISPLNVLTRGYSITRQKNGDIIKSIHSLSIGDEISTKLPDGYVKSTIKSIDS